MSSFFVCFYLLFQAFNGKMKVISNHSQGVE